MRSEPHLETSQENTPSYSGVYDRLVEDENDILGQIAYAIYKSQKKAFIIQKQKSLGNAPIPESIVNDYLLAQTDKMLEVYKSHAEKLAREFLDASYGKQFAQELERVEIGRAHV